MAGHDTTPIPPDVVQHTLYLFAIRTRPNRIVQIIKENYDYDFNKESISTIVKKNKKEYKRMRIMATERERANAEKILEAAYFLFDIKTKHALDALIDFQDLRTQYDRKKIDRAEYESRRAQLDIPTLSDLTALAKEMRLHVLDARKQQAEVDAGQFPETEDTPVEPKKPKPRTIDKYLEGKSEEEIMKEIFPDYVPETPAE